MPLHILNISGAAWGMVAGGLAMFEDCPRPKAQGQLLRYDPVSARL